MQKCMAPEPQLLKIQFVNNGSPYEGAVAMQ
jgi:hypothetical protein